MTTIFTKNLNSIVKPLQQEETNHTKGNINAQNARIAEHDERYNKIIAAAAINKATKSALAQAVALSV